MTEPVSLLPVRPSEVAVGKPLSQPVFDWHGNVLLASGCVIESQAQLEGIIENGFFQDASWDLTPKGDAKKDGTAAQKKEPEVAKEVVARMDDMHWFVGETMYLQLQENPAVRYTVHLIGFVKNKTVFVTAPMLDGKFELIRDGQTFVVRAFSGKKAYAFIASAVKSVHTPHPYLHLSYPKEVRCTVVRQSARVQVKIIASVALGEPERVAAGIITDLSMGGASGILKDLLGKKGEAGTLKFKVNAADFDSFLNVKTILRSVAQSEDGAGFRHGFEFVDVPIHDRLILSAFVHQTLAETN